MHQQKKHFSAAWVLEIGQELRGCKESSGWGSMSPGCRTSSCPTCCMTLSKVLDLCGLWKMPTT